MADDAQIWSDAAKALTLRAASSVGLGTEGTLPLITEPEAAAVYSLRNLPHDLKVARCYPQRFVEKAYMQAFTDQRHVCGRRLWRRHGGRLRSFGSSPIETYTSEHQNLGFDLVRDYRVEAQAGS